MLDGKRSACRCEHTPDCLCESFPQCRFAHSRSIQVLRGSTYDHLQDAGRAGTRCNPTDSDERCVKELQNNNVAFQSYTQYFHHVSSGVARYSYAQKKHVVPSLLFHSSIGVHCTQNEIDWYFRSTVSDKQEMNAYRLRRSYWAAPFDAWNAWQVNAICHHLSHTVWQEQTEGLVRGLTASSLATFDRAEQSLMKQELVGIASSWHLQLEMCSYWFLYSSVEDFRSPLTTFRGRTIVVRVQRSFANNSARISSNSQTVSSALAPRL